MSDIEWSAERVELVLAAAGLGEWRWDPATDVITFSTRAADIYGVSRGARYTRRQLRELIHPDDRERARLEAERASTENGDYCIEYRVITPEGRQRWLQVDGRSRYDEHGRAAAMYGIVRDLTTDRFLLRLDDVLRSLSNPEDVTMNAARELGEHLRVNRCAYASVEADQDTFDLTGNYTFQAHSIVGQYRFRQFGEECLRQMRAGEAYVVADSETDARTRAELASYRQTAIRAVICVPVHRAGRFVAAMAVHATTPRLWHASEVELVQRVASRCWESIERARIEREREDLLRDAEAANRTKDEFLAVLGHELRNPLSPIVTALQLMRLRGDQALERERTIIERQVGHLTRLVDDLLDVARITRGTVQLSIAEVNVAEIVTRALETANPLLQARHHSVAVDVPAQTLLIRGDADRLVQVVANLLNNAAKYSPPASHIRVAALMEETHVRLTVSDSGDGMTPELLQQAFEPFAQGHQGIERAGGGLGLGLAIVRALVAAHGGEVQAQSEGPGRGSRFVIRLPALRSSTRPSSVPSAPLAVSAASGGLRVLAVDDNEDALALLAVALRESGHSVLEAPDPATALRVVEAQRVDVALLDIGLPQMDGYELARRLRALPHLAEVRLIALTGYGQPADRQRALDAGFDEHLTKPVSLDVLDRALLQHVRR